MSDHRAVLEEYRGLREALETSVLPLATSVDGYRFEYQASLHGLELEAGGYVAIEARGTIRLGQLLSLRMEQHEARAHDRPGAVLIRVARGDGALLEGDSRPFHDALVRPATEEEEVSAWLERSQSERVRLEVGELAVALSKRPRARLAADLRRAVSSVGAIADCYCTSLRPCPA